MYVWFGVRRWWVASTVGGVTGGWQRWWGCRLLVRLSLSVFRLVLVMVSLVVQMVGVGKGDPYPGVVVALGRRCCFRWCS